SLATNLDLRTGGAMLRDAGAVRDLAASLAEGLQAYLREVSARLPGAALVLQIDEPSLPAVLAGQVPTESGFSTLPAIEETVATETLREIVSAVGVPVIFHCCAPDPPVEL